MSRGGGLLRVSSGVYIFVGLGVTYIKRGVHRRWGLSSLGLKLSFFALL